MPLSRRQKMSLAALSAAENAAFGPAQVQKLFFLLDENIAQDMGGRIYNFEPYDYGPFDVSVYHELDSLRDLGLVDQVQMHPGPAGRRYVLTRAGYEEGARELAALPDNARAYMSEVNAWVRRLSFSELVGAIYKAYPHMKARSIFVD